MNKSIRLFTSAIAIITLSGAPNVFAASKEIIQLQTQVQQLQDAVSKLQQTDDERMAVLKSLIEQTADSVNKMSSGLDAIQQTVGKQQEADGAKLDQVSGQIQSMNDSMDELRARLAKLEKSVQDIQSSEQSINATLQQGASQPAGAAAAQPPTTGLGGGPQQQAALAATEGTGGSSSAPTDASANPAPPAGMAAAPSAPPVEQLYQTAFGDFNGAKYTLASAEFGDVIKFYPSNSLAGNAYFYLGEIDYKQGRFAPAVKNYNQVIENFPGNNKIPASELRKGQCLLSLKEKDAGVKELRALIQRYPNSPEAAAARSRLNALGLGPAAGRATR